MARKKGRKPRHIPQRTCIGCRQVLSKRAMIRIVRTSEGVQVDPTGRLPGRGAYLHPNRACWDLSLKGRVEKALKTALSSTDRARLGEFAQTLPEEAETEAPQPQIARD